MVLGFIRSLLSPPGTHLVPELLEPARAATGAAGEGSFMRRAWRMEKAGRLSDLVLKEEALAAPGEKEVRVAVKAIGLNFADIFAVIGLYGATPKGSFVPGLEYSGTVDAVGKGVTSLKKGDRVYGFTRFGAYTSHLNVPEPYCRVMPSSWSFAEGASFLVQGLTAWHAMVDLGATKKGQVVLVHSAAGGVGALAMELCQKLGAHPIATIGSDKKVGFLVERFGVKREQIIVRSNSAAGFRAQLQGALESCQSLFSLKRKQEGFDVVLDALGGFYFKESFELLSRGGRMVTFGAATFMSPKNGPDWLKIIPNYLSRPFVDPGQLCSDNRSVMGFNLIWLTDKVEELNEELDDMLRYEWRPPHVGSTFSFEELPAACKALQGGQTVGKVVVLVDETPQTSAS